MKIGKCFIGFDFLLIMTAFYVLDTDGLFLCTVLAALVHELGHIVTIKLCGAKIDSITLGAYGAKIEMKLYPIISYKREILIALAGPAAGAIIGLLLSFWGNYTLAGINLILTAFNLLPALPLDGGSAVKHALLLICDEFKQEKISKFLNAAIAFLLIVFCIYVSAIYGVSPSLCVFCIFTATGFLKELFE